MTTWRELLADQIEGELLVRFGGAIEVERKHDDAGALRICVTWRGTGGGAFVMLPANEAINAVSADKAVEHVTGRLWEYAPIAGSC